MVNQYTIQGGQPVKGSIICSGTKNFATKAMIASLLGKTPSELHNIPLIGDVTITQDMLRSLGVSLELDQQEKILSIDPRTINTSTVTTPDSGTNRMPILLMSPLLHIFDEVFVPVLGGCNIGTRKVDFHIQALREFGAIVEEGDTGYRAYKKGRLQATDITLAYPSVGATETFLMLAVLSEGESVLYNAAVEPEILELMTFLRAMGAYIFLGENRTIRVKGVQELQGSVMNILGDRIEAVSWACLACATDGDITVQGFRPDTLGNFLSYYQMIGGGFEILDSETVRFFRKEPVLRPVMLETDVWPGFSTDWQQPFSVVLTQAEGVSVVHETVYEKRFRYLQTLQDLGARVQLTDTCLGSLACRYKGKGYPHSAIITGKTVLHSDTTIAVPDLRAGLAYIIAAQIAQGQTVVTGIETIERGYGDLISKLKDTNMNITKVLL